MHIVQHLKGTKFAIKTRFGDFHGSSVVKTPRSQCRGHGFDPWSGNRDLVHCKARPKKQTRFDCNRDHHLTVAETR